MFKIATTIVATLVVSGFVHAQDAVQWTQAEGGNGHWYQLYGAGERICWTDARSHSLSLNGDLATPETTEANRWIKENIALDVTFWIGLYQDLNADDYSEPAGGWYWLNGSPLQYDDWRVGQPDEGPNPTYGDEHWGNVDQGVDGNGDPTWRDVANCGGETYQIDWWVVEWSADCNGDGIVDYGQILDGSLADDNGNGVPDCCEDATCLPAVQWKVEDGGNDNWYRFVKTEDLVAWDVAASDASNLGGHLATITTPDENQYIVDNFDGLGSGQVWIGLFQNTSSPDYSEPGGGWEWITQEPFNWNNWTPTEPNNSGKGEQSEEWGNIWLTGGDQPNYIGFWNDNVLLDVNRSDSYLVEWSADCNGDGIVDYGQILDGSLLDENGNGIPDICQQLDFGACCYNGGCVLTTNAFCFDAGGSYAGDGTLCKEVDCPTTCPGDIDGDGQVGIVDILVVIDRWGFCP